MPARSQGAELECSQQILALQVRVVNEHVLDRHPSRKQLQQPLDRVSQAAYHRLAVTHRRINGDPLQEGHEARIPASRLRVPNAAARTWGKGQATKPTERMAAIAREIAAEKPPVVGLQEVTTWTVHTDPMLLTQTALR